MNRRKLLLQYLLIYPAYNVVGMAVSTVILYLLFSWSVDYAKSFFYGSSVVLVVIFYALNISTIFQMFVSGGEGSLK